MNGMDLTAFLSARLDEDEQSARETAGDERYQRWALDESADYNEGALVSLALRVLAEVDAKRRIVELHQTRFLGSADDPFQGCLIDDDDYPCLTLRLLALPYADHPGYQEGWRP